jgi:hypothetical protein
MCLRSRALQALAVEPGHCPAQETDRCGLLLVRQHLHVGEPRDVVDRHMNPLWLAVKTTSQPDKNAIKEALQAGRQISGAQLLSRRSWRIH